MDDSLLSANGFTSWGCQQCTFINNIEDGHCRMCSFDRPTANGRNGFLQRLKLPHFSFSAALERIDSAIDVFANSISPRNGTQVQFYPPHHQAAATPAQTYSNWTCAQCSQVNPAANRNCNWCNVDRMTDITLCYWTCSNPRCGLRQPTPPANARCPLCRTKTAMLSRQGHSRSMPRLDLDNSHWNNEDASPFVGLVEEKGSSQEHTPLYQEIMQFCRNNKQVFLDDSFPHSMRSVGPVHLLDRQDLSIEWLRPEHIVTRDGRIARWSIFNDPRPSDIEQGLLGNCWFLSALAVVSERPDVLEKLFLTREYNHFGVYEMRLCIDGVWQHVLVDDFLPCHRRGRTMIFAVGRKNQLWVSLIEKALAKVYGNYAALRAGRTVEGLSSLTGAPTLSVDLEFTELDPTARLAALDIAWAKLLSAREARFLMGCSCGAGRRQIDEQEYRRVGLMSQHAYSLLDIRQTRDGHRLVYLRNPWGTCSWLGEFSTGWPGWTPQLRSELSSTAAVCQPGTFWMPFERFAQYFDTVDIAQLRDMGGRWSTVRFLLDICWESGKSRLVRMIITEPTELCITLHQRNARTALDQVDIMVLVHRQEGDGVPGELVFRSPRKIQPAVRTDDFFLRPGEYLVCAHSFAKFADKQVPATIVIHSSKSVFTEMLHAPLCALQRSFCALLLKEGVAQQFSPTTMLRYLTEEFAGLALMIDNTSAKYCVQVQSDCQKSTNVLSTRASLLAVDSIPPLHRQIVTVLTHFEPSQAFMVTHKLAHRNTPFPQLSDFAPSQESTGSQNFPPLLNNAVGTLHGPTALYI